MKSYKHIIIGNGLIGSAAARHLASSEGPNSILVIGPDEPPDWKLHNGVFSSHYDSGRITRILDTDYVWAKLAKESIARYETIEQSSGIKFASFVGCLKVVPDNDWGRAYLRANADIGDQLSVNYEQLSHQDLSRRFPYFHFPSSVIAILETSTAGWINPRLFKMAQNKLAEAAGVQFCKNTVVGRRSVESGGNSLITDKGEEFFGENLLLTAGAFTNFFGITPEKLKLTVRAETTVLGEISNSDPLDGMPAVIWFLEDNPVSNYVYLVPPVVYPEGKLAIKIGGDSERDHTFSDPDSIARWFHSSGGQGTREAFAESLEALFPDIDFLNLDSKPCVITDTVTERPYIGLIEASIFVATGGCGAAAKSSDEIGRLGAAYACAGKPDDAYPTDAFRVITESTPADEMVASQRQFHF